MLQIPRWFWLPSLALMTFFFRKNFLGRVCLRCVFCVSFLHGLGSFWLLFWGTLRGFILKLLYFGHCLCLLGLGLTYPISCLGELVLFSLLALR